jgi:hypothetical protein
MKYSTGPFKISYRPLKTNISKQLDFHNLRRMLRKEKECRPSPHKAQRLGCRAFVRLRRQSFDFVGAAPFTGGECSFACQLANTTRPLRQSFRLRIRTLQSHLPDHSPFDVTFRTRGDEPIFQFECGLLASCRDH